MDSKTLYKEYSELIDSYYEVRIYSEGDYDSKKEHLETIINLLKNKSISLYNLSKSENYYWSFCSYRTYFNTYAKRLSEFLDLNDDKNAIEDDFVISEIRTLNFLKNSEYIDFIDDSIKSLTINELNKKINFLQNKNISTSNYKSDIYKFTPFTSFKAEQLFNRYCETHINPSEEQKNLLIEISFIYRQMYVDGFIHKIILPEMFKRFISEAPYNYEIIHPLKTHSLSKSVTRENNYKIIKELVS